LRALQLLSVLLMLGVTACSFAPSLPAGPFMPGDTPPQLEGPLPAPPVVGAPAPVPTVEPSPEPSTAPGKGGRPKPGRD
jgi:hypothetical protein